MRFKSQKKTVAAATVFFLDFVLYYKQSCPMEGAESMQQFKHLPIDHTEQLSGMVAFQPNRVVSMALSQNSIAK